jgi:CHAT domain-containing protein
MTLALVMAVAILTTSACKACAEDHVEKYGAADQAYKKTFDVTGQQNPIQLVPVEQDRRSLVDATGGEAQARALLEIGLVQSKSSKKIAALTLTKAAELATRLGRSDIAFDAWIAAAHAYIRGTHDHAAAEAAVDRAVGAAGASPSPKQRFEIVRYYAERAVARGDLETGLVGALDAVRLAPAPDGRLRAEHDVAWALWNIAEKCLYRPIRDERSQYDPPNDPWGACRRAVAAAHAAYDRAARTADGIGSKGVADMLRQQARTLIEISWLLGRKALKATDVFEPRDKNDVFVWNGRSFARRGRKEVVIGAFRSLKRGNVPGLKAAKVRESFRQIGEALRDGDKDDPDKLHMHGLLLELQNKPEQAAELYARAAHILAVQRASFFDPRRRGTVIEDYGEVFPDLALRLVALNRDADAFAALEDAHARGLNEVEQVLAEKDVTAGDRMWLAELLRLEAETSAAEASIVEQVIAEARLDVSTDDLLRWERSESARNSYLLSNPRIRDRFARAKFSPVSLTELKQAAGRSGIPVLIYWVADPYIWGWYVGPHGSELRVVFLPERVLTQKIAQLVGSIDSPEMTFDERAARELYLYLIAPFEDLLDDAKQVMIVPQGPIVGLPVEALVASATGDFLVDRWVVSYAPNSTMAYQALNRPTAEIAQVTAIFDTALDYTKERKGIESVPGLQLRTFNSNEVLPDKLGDALRGAQSVHILLHGRFDMTEPLRSVLGGDFPATGLLALPIEGMKLVVLSACESGRLGVRISNEIYGFPWALLAGGVENVVTSRWIVAGASNGAWMQSFYGSLVNGSSPAAAAASAMRTMYKEGERNPYFWAAMQVNGR